MRKYEKILVAVDGTESSENAFRQGCKIARENKSRITALTPILPTADPIGRATRIQTEEGQNILSGIEKIAKEEDVSMESLLGKGRPSDTIIDTAEEGYDLIVMGRYGINVLEKAVMSSVVGRVIGHSGIDVLVVPEGASVGWKTIMLCTDGSKYSETAARYAIDFAKSHGGELIVISVVDITDEFLAQAPDRVEKLIEKSKAINERVRKSAEAEGLKVETYVKEGDAHLKIVELAKEKNSDVIIMGSHGRTGLRKLLMGSITASVIKYSPCPVLVIR